jgi:hypothetical protein
MKIVIKYLLLSLLLICFSALKGQQTDSVLKKVFYGLDFTLPISTNSDLLEKDARFTKRPLSLPYYYQGKTSNDGIIDIKSDSVILSILYGVGVSLPGLHSDKSLPRIHYTIFTTAVQYYYQVNDSLNKAYDNLLSFMHLNRIALMDEKDYHQKPIKRITFRESHLVEENTLKKMKKYKGTHMLDLYPTLTITKEENYFEIEFEQYVVSDN